MEQIGAIPSNPTCPQEILDSVLMTYSPGLSTRNDLDRLEHLSGTLTGDSFYFAVDPPVPKIRQITHNIINSVASIFLLFHVSERWRYNDNYDDITRPSSPSSELAFSSLLRQHKKTPSQIREYLSALEQLTNALFQKAAQWEHIVLVLPIEACRTFGEHFLARTGVLHIPRLTTFCFAITPPFLIPNINARYSSTAEDLSLVLDVLSAVLNAPETKNTLKNLFFEFTPYQKMLERTPTADISEAPSALGVNAPFKTSLLPYPLRDLSKHSLRYIQVTSPCPPINVFHLLDLSKGSLEHLVVPISYGPLFLDEGEQRDNLILPKLKVLQATLLQSTREDDPFTALSLLKYATFPGLERLVIIWPALLFERRNTVGAPVIQRHLEDAVGSAIPGCALQIKHYSEAVVNGLRQSLQGWSQINVGPVD